MNTLTLDYLKDKFGIDAETGETVFTEWYEVDITPHYVMYSLPETWKKLAGET